MKDHTKAIVAGVLGSVAGIAVVAGVIVGLVFIGKAVSKWNVKRADTSKAEIELGKLEISDITNEAYLFYVLHLINK